MTAITLQMNAPPDATDREPVVEQLMTPDVAAITADADLLVASRLMAERAVRHLPVMDGGHCRGLLLEIDVIQALATAHNPFSPRLAGEVCRAAPGGAARRPPVRRGPAHARQRRRRRRGLGENNSVVGILTATDLIWSLAEEAFTPAND